VPSVRARRFISALALWLGLTLSAAAQFQDAPPEGPEQGRTAVERWRIGFILTAGSGPCRGIVATTSVPTDWPEQQVRIVDEEVSPGVRVTRQMIEGAVQQMTARIRSLAPGEQARAIVTFEIKRSWQSAPEETDGYVLPSTRRSDRKMRSYLSPSPYIESTDPQIKALADKIGVDEPKAWSRVEAIYEWVREKVELEDNRGRGVKTTLQTLRDGTGDCDELTSLFVAICRAGGIPARTVRVPGHCYPEFYLDDAQGKGHWFPCDPTTSNALGELAELRPVLQKGDKLLLRDPQTKRTKAYRFLPDNLVIADHRGSAPELKLILERVGD
jgi:transglutaminase-like putative cysteine protease